MALFFCLDTKNQKSSQTEGFFAALGLPCKTGRTWAGNFYPLLRRSLPCASVKISYALRPHRPPLFCLFSAEAVELTGGDKVFPFQLITLKNVN